MSRRRLKQIVAMERRGIEAARQTAAALGYKIKSDRSPKAPKAKAQS